MKEGSELPDIYTTDIH